jgi:branched-subunit amino acid aminotransferase/4-amino-4-deoxychorismate lyase
MTETFPPAIWINGEFRPGGAPAISVFDQGFTHGAGIYETLLALDGVPLHFEMHWARLSSSAEALRLPLPVEPASMLETLVDLLGRNGLERDRARLRLTLSRGPSLKPAWEPPGEASTLVATAIATGPPRTQPLSVRVLPWLRDPGEGIWQHKTTNFLARGLARASLVQGGEDDGIAMNTHGHICEGTTSNLFAFVGGKACTPPVEDGLLPGITRARTLQAIGWSKEWSAEERSLTLDDLVRAEAIWLSSAISHVQPISHLNGALLECTAEGHRLMDWLRERLEP